eukprot:ANDGO_04507.mRNA.1 Sodium/hydrogen exchanger 1
MRLSSFRVLAALLLCSLLVLNGISCIAANEEEYTSPICVEEEHLEARLLLMLFGLLAISLVIVYLLLRFHFHYLPESIAMIAVGALAGLFVKLSSSHDDIAALRLSPEVFFIFLLPSIIFEAGYSLEKTDFFGNIGSIVLYAVFGTVISTIVIAIGLYAFGTFGASASLSLLDCLLFGALISAVDPVATLAIFSALNVNPTLHYLVFGESVVNDAVAIVLYKTFEYFVDHEFSGVSVMLGLWQFMLLFFGSTILGIAVGFATALFFKYVAMRDHLVLALSMLTVQAYMGYLLAEAISLSGIMCVLTSGMVLSYYVRPNLTEELSVMSARVFKMFAFISESFVFLYLGFAIFVFDHKVHYGLIFWGIVFCMLGRAANIYPLTLILNTARTNKISAKNQFVMFFSGLRGAIAFALAIGLVGPKSPVADGEMIFTTTLAIVMFTIVVFGGSTLPLLKLLKVEPKVTMSKMEEFENVTSAQVYWSQIMSGRQQRGGNWLVRLDEKYLRRWFSRVETLPPTVVREQTELSRLDSYWHVNDPEDHDEARLIGAPSATVNANPSETVAPGSPRGGDLSPVRRSATLSPGQAEVVHILDDMVRDPVYASKLSQAVDLYKNVRVNAQ